MSISTLLISVIALSLLMIPHKDIASKHDKIPLPRAYVKGPNEVSWTFAPPRLHLPSGPYPRPSASSLPVISPWYAWDRPAICLLMRSFRTLKISHSMCKTLSFRVGLMSLPWSISSELDTPMENTKSMQWVTKTYLTKLMIPCLSIILESAVGRASLWAQYSRTKSWAFPWMPKSWDKMSIIYSKIIMASDWVSVLCSRKTAIWSSITARLVCRLFAAGSLTYVVDSQSIRWSVNMAARISSSLHVSSSARGLITTVISTFNWCCKSHSRWRNFHPPRSASTVNWAWATSLGMSWNSYRWSAA